MDGKRIVLGGVLGLLAATASADCRIEGVAVGDLEDAVLARCGRPDYTERWRQRAPDGGVQRVAALTWNFGPRHPVLRVVVADGTVGEVDRSGRGVREIGRGCRVASLQPGLRTSEVFLACGPPHSRTQRFDADDDHVAGDDGDAGTREETWRYQLPGSSQRQVLHFRDGRLDRSERERP